MTTAEYIDSINNLIRPLPDELADLVLELRDLVLSVAPQATESTHSKGFTYHDAQRGGHVSAGICQIVIFPDHVRLAFIHGIFLPDPHRLLEGDARYKRYVKIVSGKIVRWDMLADLIRSSANFDPRSLREE
jgi:hypothetical protein